MMKAETSYKICIPIYFILLGYLHNLRCLTNKIKSSFNDFPPFVVVNSCQRPVVDIRRKELHIKRK